jgi:hypothetical protein
VDIQEKDSRQAYRGKWLDDDKRAINVKQGKGIQRPKLK